MNPYVELQQCLMHSAREQVRRDARSAAARVRDAAQRILADLDADDLGATRARFRELACLLPQYLQPIDDHLKEAEVVARFAANLANQSNEEAAR